MAKTTYLVPDSKESDIQEITFDLGGIFFMWPEAGYFSAWADRLSFAKDQFYSL